MYQNKKSFKHKEKLQKWDQKHLNWVFQIWKQLPNMKPPVSNLLKCNISCKTKEKTLSSGPKIPFWGIFGLQLGEAIILFAIDTLKHIKFQSFI